MPWYVAEDLAGSNPRPLQVSAKQLDGNGQAGVDVAAASDSPNAFYPTIITFSNPGCWEVTGAMGGESLTVILVVLISPVPDQGTPSAHRDTGVIRVGLGGKASRFVRESTPI
jgi:hypothetical protein